MAMQDEFSNADFCNIVFDNFLLGLTSQTAAIRHTLRLLWFIHPKMDSHKVVQILTATQPGSEVKYRMLTDDVLGMLQGFIGVDIGEYLFTIFCSLAYSFKSRKLQT
jgi:hypothetical protein